jgi:UDPglucose 6-dehydrogenase
LVEIAPALKLDRRIGPYAYLTPGLGIAGGNLERDLATATLLSEAHGTPADRRLAAQQPSPAGLAAVATPRARVVARRRARHGILGVTKENTIPSRTRRRSR